MSRCMTFQCQDHQNELVGLFQYQMIQIKQSMYG